MAPHAYRIVKRGEPVYFLPDPQLDHLVQAKDWLGERVKACEATEGASSGQACADSVLTVSEGVCFVWAFSEGQGALGTRGFGAGRCGQRRVRSAKSVKE